MPIKRLGKRPYCETRENALKKFNAELKELKKMDKNSDEYKKKFTELQILQIQLNSRYGIDGQLMIENMMSKK